MKFLIHLVTESEVGQQVQEIACLERNQPHLENIGLSLWEAKQLLSRFRWTSGVESWRGHGNVGE